MCPLKASFVFELLQEMGKSSTVQLLHRCSTVDLARILRLFTL